jgi:methylase of polypeptide subunit release factors
VYRKSARADRMLAVAKIGSSDLVYDLGCGDGRIVINAAKKYGAHAVGFDLNPVRVAEARENVRQAGVESLVTVRRADLFSVDASPATVAMMYLHPYIDARLLPELAHLAPGTEARAGPRRAARRDPPSHHAVRSSWPERRCGRS